MTWIGDRLARLSQCLCEELARTTSGPVCSCLVAPGAEADLSACGSCDDGGCGMAWVRVQQVYSSTDFPEAAPYTGCAAPLAYTLEVGVSRCFRAPDIGEVLEPGVALDATLGQMEDVLAVRRAILCCFGHGALVAMGEYTPRGPEGGCVGGDWAVTVAEP